MTVNEYGQTYGGLLVLKPLSFRVGRRGTKLRYFLQNTWTCALGSLNYLFCMINHAGVIQINVQWEKTVGSANQVCAQSTISPHEIVNSLLFMFRKKCPKLTNIKTAVCICAHCYCCYLLTYCWAYYWLIVEHNLYRRPYEYMYSLTLAHCSLILSGCGQDNGWWC